MAIAFSQEPSDKHEDAVHEIAETLEAEGVDILPERVSYMQCPHAAARRERWDTRLRTWCDLKGSHQTQLDKARLSYA